MCINTMLWKYIFFIGFNLPYPIVYYRETTTIFIFLAPYKYTADRIKSVALNTPQMYIERDMAAARRPCMHND